MSLYDELSLVASATPDAITSLHARLDDGDWIEKALTATGVATIRRRRLPAEQVVWLVIGMALMRDRRIEEVVRTLDLALPVPSGRDVVTGAIPPARERLGVEPVKWLFSETSKVWSAEGADAQRWRGLAVYGVDGTTLRVQDTLKIARLSAVSGRVNTRATAAIRWCACLR